MLPIICITGCSSGFGQHIALKAAETCEVVATVRSEKAKAALLEKAIKLDCVLDIQLCDVNQQDDVAALARHINHTYKRLDILINNAGIAIGGFFEDMTQQQVQDVLHTNVLGVMHMTRAMLPLLRESKQAKIINMSSIAGLTGSPLISVYNASKWALEGFSEALLFELKPFNIAVVLIEPGQYKTQIFDQNLKFGKDAFEPSSLYYKWTCAAHNMFKKRLKTRLQDPSKVAQLCVKIIHQAKPRFRYLIGKDAWARYLLRRYMPFSWYRRLCHYVIKRTFNHD